MTYIIEIVGIKSLPDSAALSHVSF